MSNVQNPKSDIESNPIGKSLNVNVSIPKQIKIDLVDASTLSDFEIWVFICSLLSNFVVGFAVAWAQAISGSDLNTVYKIVTCIFFVLLIFSGIMVFIKYQKLSKEKNSFNMEVKDVQ